MQPLPVSPVPLSASLLPGVPIVESPLFADSIDAMGLSEIERMVATGLNRRGFAVIDFPDPDLAARIGRIKANLAPRYGAGSGDAAIAGLPGNPRIQDAWQFDDDVKAIAANPDLLALLGKLYGRRAFPFQTLNFPVGTEQHAHADAVHFSSQPERFMCGVWLAMEDISADSGPLLYYPGSHKWPIVSNVMIGERGWDRPRHDAQEPFEAVWRAMVAANRIEPETFLPRKGQALIWAANLLHGGSARGDRARTRWSQVTHYYFADCAYYTPAFSDEPFGRLDLRTITNVATGQVEPNRLLGEDVLPVQPPRPPRRKSLWRRTIDRYNQPSGLPADFDADAYLDLNPDVAAGAADPAMHYLRHGRQEGRRYRSD